METLRPPAAWWAVGFALVCSMGVVLWASTPGWLTVAGTVAAGAVIGGMLGAAAPVQVGVRDGELVAGRAHICLTWCGEVIPLDAVATRRVRGPDADANAFLVLRPWVATAVQVEIRDPADPTPYWLVSTRHPDRFVDAVRSHRRDAAR